MNRREAVVSVAMAGVAIALPGCAVSGNQGSGVLTDEQMRAMLRLNGMDLEPGEGPKVLASFVGSRFTAQVDPTIQPQADFDADVDP